MKFAHSVEYVKEKGEGSSLDIRLEKCEQFQNLEDSSKETKIVYVDQIYTSKYKKFLSYYWI
jgi:hypothetical protein